MGKVIMNVFISVSNTATPVIPTLEAVTLLSANEILLYGRT